MTTTPRTAATPVTVDMLLMVLFRTGTAIGGREKEAPRLLLKEKTPSYRCGVTTRTLRAHQPIHHEALRPNEQVGSRQQDRKDPRLRNPIEHQRLTGSACH